MTPNNFRLIAQTARELRTEAATYTLLDAYARNGCATYPTDSALFLELWPDGQVPGYVLTTYHSHYGNSHTVAYDMSDDEPDARLIAAAPDLLEALRFMTAYAALNSVGCTADESPLVDILLDLTDGYEGDNGCLAETIQMARAAIAKAEGGAE